MKVYLYLKSSKAIILKLGIK
jgi:hypothetical protein